MPYYWKEVKRMDVTQAPSRAGRKSRSQRLRRRINTGRITLLVISLVSLLNQLLLLLGVDYHFLFSAATPYYLNWLGQALSIYHAVTFYKIIAMVISIAVFALLMACWVFSAHDWKWMRNGLIFYCIDTLVLIIFAIGFLENPFSCTLWFLVHLIGVGLLYQAFRSSQELDQLNRRRKRREQEAAAQ
jgi:hypothetical protein